MIGQTVNDPLNPHDIDVEAVNDHVDQEHFQYHDCSAYGNLPAGYARITKYGLIFHDPKGCPRRESQQTQSTGLSLSLESSLNSDNVQDRASTQ